MKYTDKRKKMQREGRDLKFSKQTLLAFNLSLHTSEFDFLSSQWYIFLWHTKLD